MWMVRDFRLRLGLRLLWTEWKKPTSLRAEFSDQTIWKHSHNLTVQWLEGQLRSSRFLILTTYNIFVTASAPYIKNTYFTAVSDHISLAREMRLVFLLCSFNSLFSWRWLHQVEDVLYRWRQVHILLCVWLLLQLALWYGQLSLRQGGLHIKFRFCKEYHSLILIFMDNYLFNVYF